MNPACAVRAAAESGELADLSEKKLPGWLRLLNEHRLGCRAKVARVDPPTLPPRTDQLQQLPCTAATSSSRHQLA